MSSDGIWEVAMLRATASSLGEINRDGCLAVNSPDERSVGEIHRDRNNSGMYQ